MTASRRELPARPAEAFPEPRVRGAGLLRAGERLFLAADRTIARWLPEERMNPLARTGAIAVLTFLVAAATGVLLLFWYKPSVEGAWESVAAMTARPWTAGFVRSLHRYSSDACLFLVTVHALQILFRRRFAGARWLAWVTGFLLLGLLWLVGWTGYWLVWDERGGEVGRASARLLDVLPVFSDPLSRSFLTDAGLNSLLFFMVFFVHMLVPLAMAVLIWLHIARVARAKFLTDRLMGAWVIGSLLLAARIFPADLAPPAAMAREPSPGIFDSWYLMPMAAAQHLGVGAAWASLLVIGSVGISVPWLLAGRRRAPTAAVIEKNCEGCEQCHHDCPYGAIEMLPRTDGSAHHARAFVVADRCVGCGICTASCATSAIGIENLPMLEARSLVRRWAEDARRRGADEWLLVACGESAAAGLELDPNEGTCPQLPGWRVLPASCIGWLHMSVIEMALTHGMRGVLLSACGPGECPWREGVEWTELRMSGAQEPALRAERVPANRLRLARHDRNSRESLVRDALAFQRDTLAAGTEPVRTARRGERGRKLLGATLTAGILTSMTVAGSMLPWGGGREQEPQLVVSFKHPGALTEVASGPTPEELERLPVHMRPQRTTERRRAEVRLKVVVDGEILLEKSYPPSGLWGDGPSVALEEFSVSEGLRRVELFMSDDGGEAWNLRAAQDLLFEPRARCVALFDRTSGFSFHEPRDS